MGAGRFQAQTFESPPAKVTSHVTTLEPPKDPIPHLGDLDTLPALTVDPTETDDLVTSLVKRELASKLATLKRINDEIDNRLAGLRDAQERKARVTGEVAKYASFLDDGAAE